MDTVIQKQREFFCRSHPHPALWRTAEGSSWNGGRCYRLTDRWQLFQSLVGNIVGGEGKVIIGGQSDASSRFLLDMPPALTLHTQYLVSPTHTHAHTCLAGRVCCLLYRGRGSWSLGQKLCSRRRRPVEIKIRFQNRVRRRAEMARLGLFELNSVTIQSKKYKN